MIATQNSTFLQSLTLHRTHTPCLLHLKKSHMQLWCWCTTIKNSDSKCAVQHNSNVSNSYSLPKSIRLWNADHFTTLQNHLFQSLLITISSKRINNKYHFGAWHQTESRSHLPSNLQQHSTYSSSVPQNASRGLRHQARLQGRVVAS